MIDATASDTRRAARTTGGPTISVVVPTYRRPERVLALARRVLDEAGLSELVVATGADDASVAPLQALAESDERLRLELADHRMSPAEARLAGVRVAAGDVVVLLDDDVVPQRGFVDRHAAYHREAPGRAVLGAMPVRVPAVRAPGQAPVRLYAQEWQRCWDGHQDEPLRALWLGHLSLSRASYLEVEAQAAAAGATWDDAYHEDTDLGLRLLRAGLTGVAAADIGGQHLQDRDLPAVLRDAERQARGAIRLALAHPREHGELPAWLRHPAWLYAATAVPGFTSALTAAGTAVHALAGRCHLWALETGAVRLLRRSAGMSALRRELAARTEGGPR